MHGLDDFLYPITVDEFKELYFEKYPLHIAKDILNPLLSELDVDALIRATAELKPERLRANLAGKVLFPPRKASTYELVNWAKKVYESGATIVLNYVEMLDLNCRKFSVALGESLKAKVTFTIFMTPAEAQGFSPHFDTLDVFVMQVAGAKEWSLGDAVIQLPTLRQGALINCRKELQSSYQQITMLPGHILYIPRGVVHWANTSNTPSVHVTADINTATVSDFLKASIRNLDNLEWDNIAQHNVNRPLFNEKDELETVLCRLIDSIKLSCEAAALAEQARINKWK